MTGVMTSKPKHPSPTENDDRLRSLESELQSAFSRAAATSEILSVISRSPDSAQPVFDTIVQSGLTLFPEATISVALREAEEVHVVAIAGPDAAQVEAWRQRFPAPVKLKTLHGHVLLLGETLDVADVADARNQFSEGAQNFLASGYRAVAMMPIGKEGSVIGVLSVLRLEPGPLTAEEYALLQTFADQANIAVENTRLVNEMRETNAVLEAVSGQLARYIPPQLYQSIIGGQQQATIASHRKKLTVFFSDIANFTEITDQLEPEELTTLLNEYLFEMSRIAQRFDAYFDKFIGDAMMFYFGDPTSHGVKTDASNCVQMAIAMQRRLEELQSEWRAKGLIDQPFRARIGINTGYCTAGNFGSDERMDYTIIGGEVNLAARLEQLAEPGGILMAAETHSLVKDRVTAEEKDAIAVKGYSKPVRTYAVVGIHKETDDSSGCIRRETDGFSLMIDERQMEPADRAVAIEELQNAIAKLKS